MLHNIRFNFAEREGFLPENETILILKIALLTEIKNTL